MHEPEVFDIEAENTTSHFAGLRRRRTRARVSIKDVRGFFQLFIVAHDRGEKKVKPPTPADFRRNEAWSHALPRATTVLPVNASAGRFVIVCMENTTADNRVSSMVCTPSLRPSTCPPRWTFARRVSSRLREGPLDKRLLRVGTGTYADRLGNPAGEILDPRHVVIGARGPGGGVGLRLGTEAAGRVLRQTWPVLRPEPRRLDGQRRASMSAQLGASAMSAPRSTQTRKSVVQHHIEVMREKLRETSAFADFESLEIYGEPNEALTEWIARVSQECSSLSTRCTGADSRGSRTTTAV